MDGVTYDADRAEEFSELLVALRFKVENDLP